MKLKLIILLSIGTIFVSGCSCSLKPQKDEEKNGSINSDATIITDEGAIGEKNVNGILLENTTFSVIDGITTIVTQATNNTGAEFLLKNYQMIITDKKGKILTILDSEVNKSLTIGETTSFTTTFMLDLSNASKVDYKINIEK